MGEGQREGFSQAEANYGEGRGDRYDVVRYIFEKVSGRPTEAIPSLVAAAARAFDAHVQERISEVGIEPSDGRALATLATRYYT
jgi:hypothetical protein